MSHCKADDAVTELKPCPFCGSEDIGMGISLATFMAVCFSCGTLGPKSETMEAAEERWNMRRE